MNYLLFANSQTGSPILTELVKAAPPKVVVTQLSNVDSWKMILYRFLKNRLTIEDKLRFYYKIEFHDYNSLNTQRLKTIIERNNIEIGFITTFTHMIPKELFELFPKGLYNFHPSLLPRHGGANPFFWVIFSEDEFTGTTCHRVTSVLDQGEIIIQTRYPVKNMNSCELFKLYVKDIKTIIPDIVNNYEYFHKKLTKMERVEYDPKELPKLNISNEGFDKKVLRLYKRANKPIY